MRKRSCFYWKKQPINTAPNLTTSVMMSAHTTLPEIRNANKRANENKKHEKVEMHNKELADKCIGEILCKMMRQ